ncbi:hypothetical protein C1645_828042 [Glomus cerebriforme]|uniref:Uncharacterized protein n=1 Tax=Glomus cerebriforme TaxID=658196 RepID=A0A397SWI3_9GLOM|nr:hypothetical protein C1645_828042 [Glomus cerebriforme]
MDLRKITWLAHCDARAEWEKSINITQRSKKSRYHVINDKSAPRSRSSSIRSPHLSQQSSNAFASSLWLIWASSNFLHSGSWTHHRSITLQHPVHTDFNSFITSCNLDLYVHPLLSTDKVSLLV